MPMDSWKLLNLTLLMNRLLTPTLGKGDPSPCDGAKFTLSRISSCFLEYCRQHGSLTVRGGQQYRYFGVLKEPGGTTVVRFAAGPTKPWLKPWIWINPSVGGLTLGQMLGLLVLAVGSVEALDSVILREIHLKVDIEGITVDELRHMVRVKYGRQTRDHLGTVYINSRKGIQFVLYDRGAKQGDSPGKLTRLEIRVKFKTDKARGQTRPTAADLAHADIDLWQYLERVLVETPEGDAYFEVLQHLPGWIDDDIKDWHSNHLGDHFLTEAQTFLRTNAELDEPY